MQDASWPGGTDGSLKRPLHKSSEMVLVRMCCVTDRHSKNDYNKFWLKSRERSAVIARGGKRLRQFWEEEQTKFAPG